MIEDYAIRMRTAQAVPTGTYEITRRGTRRAVTRLAVRYQTPVGTFSPEEWKKHASAEIEKDGKTELLDAVKRHCKRHCAWLHTETELEEYALECLCSSAYRVWPDFVNEGGEKN